MTDWNRLFSYPEVEQYTLCGLAPVDELLDFLKQPHVEVEEYEKGVIAYVQKEGFKEVHVAFEPSCWGREVAFILKESFGKQMQNGTILSAGEQEGYYRSRPPLSHGWKVNGEFESSEHPRRIRQWILTPDAWYRSAVGRKYNELCC